MIYNLKNLGNKKNFIVYVSLIPISIWLAIFASDLIYQPFIWDDLHFFRNYTLGELKSTWTGNWDPDNIETPSYRPVAVIYYHTLYTVFGENTFFLRIFIFLKAFLLLFIINSFLNFLNFKKEEILIFSFLITFSKIFTTLIAWFTISLLLTVYILSIISIYFFIKSIDEKKISFYLLSFFLAFLAIFMREELYVLPAILIQIFFLKNKISLKNFFKCFVNIIPYLILVFLHMFLRKYFVPEAEHFEINNFTIFFGDNPLGFGGLIKSIKSSFLPMGYLSSHYSDLNQVYFASAWIILILTSLFLICLKFKFDSKNLKKIYILFFLIFCCSLPHITIARSFGIFLPTVFALLIISILINSVFSMSFNFKFFRYFAVLIFAIGITGGIYRSNLHVKSMNVFAKDIVFYDSQFIYGYKEEGKVISIPQKRYQNKKLHLQNLNIDSFDTNPERIFSSSTKIRKSKYHPLWF